MRAHTLEFLKKKNKNEIYKRIKLKRKLRKSNEKKGENLSKNKNQSLILNKGKEEGERKGLFAEIGFLC